MSKRAFKLERYEGENKIAKPVLLGFPQNVPPKTFFTSKEGENVS